MDLEVHLKFKGGTVDVHLTDVDVKTLMEGGFIKNLTETLSDFEASARASETKEEPE